MPMLRLRNAILSSSIVVCGVQFHESGSEVGVVGRGLRNLERRRKCQPMT
jgi:hypothetical protein